MLIITPLHHFEADLLSAGLIPFAFGVLAQYCARETDLGAQLMAIQRISSQHLHCLQDLSAASAHSMAFKY